MRALSVVASVSLAMGLLAFDVVDLPVAQAVPVPAQTDTVELAGVDAGAVREEGRESRPDERPAAGPAPDARPELLTDEVGTDEFAVLGVTWDADSVAADAAVVSVRVREDGDWSQWEVLGMNDTAPDPGTEEAEQAADLVATEPLVVDDADAVQVRIDTGTGEVPTGVEAVVIDPGTSRADDPAARSGTASSTAGAVAGRPSIITRAQWGADERRSTCGSGRMGTLKAAVVHHTAGRNDYGPGDSAGLIRGIYAYHTGTLGWCDVGYNMLVDRYGQVFEGRGGGAAESVRGAHAGGFNESTVGIAALGNFDTASSPAVMLDAIAGVVAWKLQGFYRDPLGTTQLTSAGGGTARFGANQVVTLPVVLGHRDVGSTACPGASLYASMDRIRQRAAELMGAGLVDPAISSTSQPVGGAFSVTAGVVTGQGFHLKVIDQCSGALVFERVGSAQRAARLTTSWDSRRADGSAAAAGGYDVVLSSWSAATNEAAVSKSWQVTVAAGTGPPPASGASPALQSGRFVPIAPARLLDTRDSAGPFGLTETRDLVVTGTAGVPAAGVKAVALNVTSTCVTRTPGSYLTVWPAGSPKPPTSSLNTSPSDTTAGLVVSGVGAGGAVSLYNDTGTGHVVVDVVGYYTDAAGGSPFFEVAPRRVFDSRNAGGPLGDGAVRVVDLAGQPGTRSAGMTGAVLNVTVTGSTGQGYVTVYPASQARPATSTINLVPGVDVANRTTIGLDGNKFAVFLRGGGSHVVVDLVGYFASPGDAAGASYQPLAPARLLDTRSGLGAPAAPLAAGGTATIAVAGTAGVPADARAVVLTLTGDQVTTPTFATVWPAGSARPGTSDVNLAPGRTRANTVVVNLGSGGAVNLYNNLGSAHYILDVVGYYK